MNDYNCVGWLKIIWQGKLTGLLESHWQLYHIVIFLLLCLISITLPLNNEIQLSRSLVSGVFLLKMSVPFSFEQMLISVCYFRSMRTQAAKSRSWEQFFFSKELPLSTFQLYQDTQQQGHCQMSSFNSAGSKMQA